MTLYPLFFKPIYKYRIWGGSNLIKYGKEIGEQKIGESWEISDVYQSVSVVGDGELRGELLSDLVKKYREKLLGEKVYNKFREKFPLLIKFLNIEEPISIQVHPNDEYALKNHNSFGKAELWYILENDKEAKIYYGLKKTVTKKIFENNLREGNLLEMIREVNLDKDSSFYISPGMIHGLKGKVTLVEIQQTSDITYRIYDFDRIDKDGKKRELNLDKALDVIDYSYSKLINNQVVDYSYEKIIDNEYFKVDKRRILGKYCLKRDRDTFRILICIKGEADIFWNRHRYGFNLGRTVLIPSVLEGVEICSKSSEVQFLEVYL